MVRADPDAETDIAWARAWLAQPAQGCARVVEVRLVESRVHHLYRLTAESRAGARSRYYLKRYGAGILEHWPEGLAHLTDIATAVDGTPGLLPFTIVAADPSRRVVLAAEVPGRVLIRLHRASIVSKKARRAVGEGWHGAGRWLRRLHGYPQPPVVSETRVAEMSADLHALITAWKSEDAAISGLADATAVVVTGLLTQFGGRPVRLVLCHGDVTAGNIMVHGSGVGLIDFDDMRLDMPGIDLSQGRLAINEFGHFSWVRSPGGLGRTLAWKAAFAAGYGRPLPDGAEFWLPHLRNLVLYLLTRTRHRHGLGPRRLVNAVRYRGLLAELRQTLTDVRRGSAAWR